VSSARVSFALSVIDCAYKRQSWHGTNLRGSLRGLSVADVARRPKRGSHNIWELVVHCAYWKYVVRRRLTGEKRGSFPLAGSNFFERPLRGASRTELARQWKDDLALLDDMHHQLRAVVAALPESKLQKSGSARRPTPLWLVQGIAAHDLYHAGQIQLLKKLIK
jgi:uncharacterized damage-inducible protein DinB